ncbi:hypothetical protein AB1Y20_020693 [Prymnesium parvum]|uniref:Uncharacterized protein n=1 Tax=Prymnesium parvum TaxID=97485 RepID=A0AB34JXN0_PRYPA
MENGLSGVAAMDMINEMFQRQARRIEAQVVQQVHDRRTIELAQARLLAAQDSVKLHTAAAEQHAQRLLWSEDATHRMRECISSMNAEHQRAVQLSNSLHEDVQGLRGQLQHHAPERYGKILASLSDVAASSLALPILAKRDNRSTNQSNDSSDGNGGTVSTVQPTGGSGSPPSGDTEAQAASASDEALVKADDSDGLPKKIRRTRLEPADSAVAEVEEPPPPSLAPPSYKPPGPPSDAVAAGGLPWYSSVAACATAAEEERGASWPWPSRDVPPRRASLAPPPPLAAASLHHSRLQPSSLQQGLLPLPHAGKLPHGSPYDAFFALEPPHALCAPPHAGRPYPWGVPHLSTAPSSALPHSLPPEPHHSLPPHHSHSHPPHDAPHHAAQPLHSHPMAQAVCAQTHSTASPMGRAAGGKAELSAAGGVGAHGQGPLLRPPLYAPSRVDPPFQGVLAFPGQGVLTLDSSVQRS